MKKPPTRPLWNVLIVANRPLFGVNAVAAVSLVWARVYRVASPQHAERVVHANSDAVCRVGRERGVPMGIILLVLLIALLLGGLGFAIHALWIIAAIVFIAWLVGFGLARGGSSGARWYRW